MSEEIKTPLEDQPQESSKSKKLNRKNKFQNCKEKLYKDLTKNQIFSNNKNSF